MPNLAIYHPQVVHFVIALGFLGVALRILSLLGRGAWLHPAAALLLVLSAGAGWAAARSGDDAHGIAERIPGAREAVIEHEDWGKRARNVLLVVAGLEVLGLLFASRKAGTVFRYASAVAGLGAAFALFEAGEHGGELVYNYAGGVGTHSGDPGDISRLLVAGLYHGARTARDSGRAEEAARLTEELARIKSDDPTVQFLLVESKLRDRNDPAGALANLALIAIPSDNPRLATRHGLLSAQALAALGQADSARAILTGLAAKFPENRAVKDALEKLR
ncbi:MAG: hypothetical protein HOP28_06850 [Gemmatimonadales bacterium]|nr:hypothetical protein [Gemmatimonadales bacterium]